MAEKERTRRVVPVGSYVDPNHPEASGGSVNFGHDTFAGVENHPLKHSDDFKRRSRAGMVIYPGKLGSVDCFRIGNIGRLYEKDIRALLKAVKAVLQEMGMSVPVAAPR